MASDFLKGVGLGIVEGAAETIDADMKRLRATQDAMINHHMTRGLKEQERHDKQQQKVAETIDKLKSLTGESDPDKSFEKAAQLFDAVGRDINAANDLFQSTQKAKSIYGDKYEISHAFDFIEPGQTPRTRDEIIQSFATGDKGIYNADNIYGEVEVPGILGKIIKPKNITKEVMSNLRGLGVETERVGEIRPGVGSVAIKYGYLNPEVAQAYKAKNFNLDKLQAELTNTGHSNTLLSKQIGDYDENEKLDLEAKIQRNKNLVNQGKKLEFEIDFNKKFAYDKEELAQGLITSQIMKNGPDSTEELLVQHQFNLTEIQKEKLNYSKTSVEYNQLNKKEQIISNQITTLSSSMSDEKFQKAVSKVNLNTLYNSYYEKSLSSLGVKPIVDSTEGRIKVRHKGTSQQEAVARYRAAVNFSNYASKVIGGKQMAATFFKTARAGITNQLTGPNMAEKIAKEKISNLQSISIQGVVSDTSLRNNLRVGETYDVTGVTMRRKEDNKIVPLKEIVESDAYKNYLARGKYAVWDGTQFIGVTQREGL